MARDGEAAAERILDEFWNSARPWEKAEIVTRLVHSTHTLALAGLRRRFPEASQHELEMRYAATHLDREIMMRALGVDPVAMGW